MVQTHILKIQPSAHYGHCASHCLNLVLIKVCRIFSIRNTMGTIGSIANFVKESPKRMAIF